MSQLQAEAIRNHRAMKQRDALFRRFGYDSRASLKFILAKVLPLPGRVLEIGTGKGRFLAAMAKARGSHYDTGRGRGAAA